VADDRSPTCFAPQGCGSEPLAEVYGIPADETIADTDWLALAGHEGWAVLMKDERIRYRPAERAAVTVYDVRAFCLTSGTSAQVTWPSSTSPSSTNSRPPAPSQAVPLRGLSKRTAAYRSCRQMTATMTANGCQNYPRKTTTLESFSL